MESSRVININGKGSDLENFILKSMDMAVSPDPQTTVLGKTVPSNTRARKYDVTMGWSNFNRIDDFN
jgi:hypothetical protein